jgi:hypothetical protein
VTAAGVVVGALCVVIVGVVALREAFPAEFSGVMLPLRDPRRRPTLREWRESLLATAIVDGLTEDSWLSVCWSCLAYRVRTRVVTLVELAGERLGLVESADSLAAWWSESVTYPLRLARAQRYVPRHSRDILYRDVLWRARWASWDTQFWPCLATTGDAYGTVDESTSFASYTQ